eukprot:366251_1
MIHGASFMAIFMTTFVVYVHGETIFSYCIEFQSCPPSADWSGSYSAIEGAYVCPPNCESVAVCPNPSFGKRGCWRVTGTSITWPTSTIGTVGYHDVKLLCDFF